MAEMLPAMPHDETPDSEKEIFTKLKTDRGCNGWIVLHSLELAQRGIRKPYGEIDFVVIIPGEGTFCLEVKGGGVKCENGIWTTTNRRQETKRYPKSPFEQVRDGGRAVRAAIEGEFGEHHKITKSYLGTAVIFTDVPTPPKAIGFEGDEVVDVNDLNDATKSISSILQTKLRSQRKRLGWLQTPSLAEPTEVSRLVRLLRPDFELKEVRATRIRRDRQCLVRLTKEQSRLLSTYAENKRCLVKGAAGTGKTILALETFKREAANQRRTGLFCYNRVLGGWLQRELNSSITEGSFCGSLHENLIALIKSANLFAEYMVACGKVDPLDKKTVFKKIIPDFAQRAIVETGQEIDFLILDEAQDLLNKELLDIFDVWLRGGLKNGSWSIFGDFHNQAIYSENMRGDALEGILEDYAYGYAKIKLILNCRNTKNIAEATALFSGFSTPPYEINQIDGDAVNQTFYKSEKELIEKLERQLEKLFSEGVSAKDIAILSPRKFSNSSAAKIPSDKFKIADVTSRSDIIPPDDTITFSTVHSFKGMESPVILLTDIENVSADMSRSLLYIGMSRASAYLSVFMHESIRSDLGQIMSQRFREKST